MYLFLWSTSDDCIQPLLIDEVDFWDQLVALALAILEKEFCLEDLLKFLTDLISEIINHLHYSTTRLG